MRLCSHKKSNTLEENSLIALSSLTIVTCLREFIIMHYSIVVSVRWLAGNSNALGQCGWSIRSMGHVNDIIYNKMNVPLKEPHKIMEESFIMTLFDSLQEELLTFKDFVVYCCNNNKTHKFIRDKIKYQPHQMLRN